MKTNATLFFTGFLQVFLVSANTWFISRSQFAGMAVCGFGISYLWTINVRKVSISTTAQRISYATGAAIGGITGVLAARMLKQ